MQGFLDPAILFFVFGILAAMLTFSVNILLGIPLYAEVAHSLLAGTAQ